MEEGEPRQEKGSNRRQDQGNAQTEGYVLVGRGGRHAGTPRPQTSAAYCCLATCTILRILLLCADFSQDPGVTEVVDYGFPQHDEWNPKHDERKITARCFVLEGCFLKRRHFHKWNMNMLGNRSPVYERRWVGLTKRALFYADHSGKPKRIDLKDIMVRARAAAVRGGGWWRSVPAPRLAPAAPAFPPRAWSVVRAPRRPTAAARAPECFRRARTVSLLSFCWMLPARRWARRVRWASKSCGETVWSRTQHSRRARTRGCRRCRRRSS